MYEKKLSPSRLADTVARLRREKSMTQAQLADATGINRALISRIEQHDFVPSIEQLEHLGEVLAFDITELFTNSCSENLASPAPMNIAVAGTGYVGLSIATLLAQHNHVTAVDIIPEKVEQINNRISPIQDEYIEKYLAEKKNLIYLPPWTVKPLIKMQILLLSPLLLTTTARKTILILPLSKPLSNWS